MRLFRTTDDAQAHGEIPRDENGATAMSQESTQQAFDEQPAATGTAGPGGYPAEAASSPFQNGDPAGEPPRPTFTPAAAAAGDDTPVTASDGPVTAATQAQAYGDLAPVDEVPMDEPLAARTTPAAFAADEPLLADSAGMRESWQKVQAGFVDDPQAAVLDAADLIEQTAQSLVEALRERQRQLRDLSGHGAASGNGSAGFGSAASEAIPDTEHLRLMMQRYRTLFNQLCSA